MKTLGEFNRKGPVTDQVEGEALDAETETPVAETASDEAAPAAEEAEAVDADGDGHDDETGQFVDGNTEAADTPDETPAE